VAPGDRDGAGEVEATVVIAPGERDRVAMDGGDGIGARGEVLGRKTEGGGEQGGQKQSTTNVRHEMVRAGVSDSPDSPRRAGPGSFRARSRALENTPLEVGEACDLGEACD
jgi:hypothetical protein